jgi:DNA-directed RNA polymerase specialized sigma24 family protein
LDSVYPGNDQDWAACCATGLYLAAYTWDPIRASFPTWLTTCLRSETSSHRRTWSRRKALLGRRISQQRLTDRLYYFDEED